MSEHETEAESTVTVVDQPFDPATTRKKRLRPPDETVAEAKARPGKAVIHSEGHTSENAARSAVKRIHSGKYLWAKWHGKIHAFTVPYDDGTFGVAVAWTAEAEAEKKDG